MDICDSLIELRIALATSCDGFSVTNSNKDILLSSRIKVLHLLSTKDMMPGELIESLGIAKSNLANLSKSLIAEGVIDSYKSMGNYRNIFYRITDKGLNELGAYKASLYKVFGEKYKNKMSEIKVYIDKVLEILKGE
jgi:DNA-binding MarR family transcriptional regulator